jgi:subtilase family serine protease
MGGVQFPTIANEEVAMDIEVTIAMAPGLDNVFVYEGPNTATDEQQFDMAAAAVLNTIATAQNSAGIPTAFQVSSSWTGFDPSFTASAIDQFVMEGISFFISAGDSGAYTQGDSVTTPPTPFTAPIVNLMTVVGGTMSNSGTGTATACLTETTWNDPSGYSSGKAAGSGGICPGVLSSAGLSLFNLQPYQSASLATSQNNGSATDRNLPDVSALAEGIAVVTDEGAPPWASGGTSAAAPLWAGFMALVNQQAGGTGLGLINPALYTAAEGTNYGNDFHDINDLSTNNEVGNTAFFQAVTGYDLATGWGTPRLGLLNGLASPAPPILPNTYTQISFVILTGDDKVHGQPERKPAGRSGQLDRQHHLARCRADPVVGQQHNHRPWALHHPVGVTRQHRQHRHRPRANGQHVPDLHDDGQLGHRHDPGHDLGPRSFNDHLELGRSPGQ